MPQFDIATLINWLISGLIGLAFGVGGAWVTHRYQRQRDDIAWEREKTKLQEQFAHDKRLLELQFAERLREVEEQLARQQSADIRGELIKGIDDLDQTIEKLQRTRERIHAPQPRIISIVAATIVVAGLLLVAISTGITKFAASYPPISPAATLVAIKTSQPTYTPISTTTPATLVAIKTSQPTYTSIPTTTPSLIMVGRSPGSLQSFPIGGNYYSPSGIIGDIGDVTITINAGIARFIYITLGRGPHEWEWAYVSGVPNQMPAQFAGVVYLDPPNNFGMKPGFDLRGIHRALKWEARSAAGPAIVEFFVGGITWVWDEKNRVKITPPSHDSMPRTVTGRATLRENWQSFEYDLSNLPEENFTNLIGGFAWVIDWGANGVTLNSERTGSEQPKTFIIEIRNIRYER